MKFATLEVLLYGDQSPYPARVYEDVVDAEAHADLCNAYIRDHRDPWPDNAARKVWLAAHPEPESWMKQAMEFSVGEIEFVAKKSA